MIAGLKSSTRIAVRPSAQALSLVLALVLVCATVSCSSLSRPLPTQPSLSGEVTHIHLSEGIVTDGLRTVDLSALLDSANGAHAVVIHMPPGYGERAFDKVCAEMINRDQLYAGAIGYSFPSDRLLFMKQPQLLGIASALVHPDWLSHRLPSSAYLLDIGEAGTAIVCGHDQAATVSGELDQLHGNDEISLKCERRKSGAYPVMDLQDWTNLLLASESPSLDPSAWCLVQTPAELWGDESLFPLRRAMGFLGYHRIGALPEQLPLGLIRFYLGSEPVDAALLYGGDLDDWNAALLTALWSAEIPFGISGSEILSPRFFAETVSRSSMRVDTLLLEYLDGAGQESRK